MSSETLFSTSQRAAELEAALRKVIRGKDDVIRLALVSMMARGHLLIEGVPGVGKTTLAQALARALDCSFQRVQFTSDMLPSDVLGISIYSAIEQQFEFKRGPIPPPHRPAAAAGSIAHRAAAGASQPLQRPHSAGHQTTDRPVSRPTLTVLTTPIPSAPRRLYTQLRTVGRRILKPATSGLTGSAYPGHYALVRSVVEGLRAHGETAEAGTAQLENLRPVLTAADVLEMQEAVKQVHVDESLVSYTLAIVKKTRESEHFSLGVSPRGSQMLYRAAQATAFLDGRNFCTPEDFKPLVIPVFAHRVVVNALYSSILKKSEQAEQVMREIVESVPVPG